MLDVITVPPASGQPPQGTIVLLHGWGANYQDLVAIAPYLNLPDYQFVFPNAPFSHPYNPVGKMWYDLPDNYSFLGTPEFAQRSDLSTSRQLLTELIHSLPETTGVPLAETILGGFSQGGAMTLDVGLNLPLAGLMILSGYLHAPLNPQGEGFPPVLLLHGTQDTVVPIRSAYRARDSLKSLGATVQYEEFHMGHEIQPIVLGSIQNFVKDLVSMG
ncbi:alpha/beta hydrolase [Pantanalinema rosaneae CENA516]|uniref:alpha/beta hydrolase n=1 Tax=Pantanalinema rosaneae TaxID=1620701 RepID=UPI003D6E0495